MQTLKLKVLTFAGAATTAMCLSMPAHAGTPTCADLGTNPAWGLAGRADVTALTVQKIEGAQARCEVNFTYSGRGGPEYGYEVGEVQQLKIRVGLPLNAADGGTGGVQGAWNGRTRNLGGGGCAGSVGSVTAATTTGYVGSSTDTGHVGSDCSFALQPDPNRLNIGRLTDFVRVSLLEQVKWAKRLAKTYYDMPAVRNYWDGCSTGGRQGMVLAQKHPQELDGWLVGAPAVNYGRFRLAQLWGPVVMKDIVGTNISSAKLNQATASATAACDAIDGVTDGIVNDPRQCTFSATANICGAPTAPASNCLTPQEAQAIDLIWDGPRNPGGKKIFMGITKTASLTSLNGAVPSQTATGQLQWNHSQLSYDWRTVTMANYGAEFQFGSNATGDIINTMDTSLEQVRDGGKKILMWNGTSDQLITTENAMDYYRRVANYMGTPDYSGLQSWFRYFRAPGVGHCSGGNGPQPQGLFEAMVNWVENGVAPATILAQTGSRSRPLCPYPTTAIYNGTGSTDDAANFHCGGNLETPSVVAAGVLRKYKFENQ